jgi:hypothetical protein
MAYSWNEYRCFMGGKFVTGIRGFSYKKSRAVEPIYAEGDEPVDVGFGNYAYEGSVKILQNELEAIILAGGGDPFKLPPFSIAHSYIPSNSPSKKVIIDMCEGCYFTEIEKAMEQGATFMEISTPLHIGKIKHNVII